MLRHGLGSAPLRALLLVLGWLVVLVLAALHALCLAGVNDPVPFDWAWAATPVLYLPAWLVLVLAGVMGSRSLGVGAGAVAIGHLAWVLPAMAGGPASVPADAPRLRVVTANVLYHNQQLDDLLDELDAYDADVIALQEVTDRVQVAVERRLGDEYEHQVLNERDDAFGSMTISRLPLRDDEIVRTAALPMLTVDVRVGDRWVQVWNVHARAPTLGFRRIVRDEMLDATRTMRGRVDGPILVVGDFNATRWNSTFRDLLDADLSDAADVVGHGLRTTWKGTGRVPIEMVLDHVLVSDDFGVLDTRVGPGVGSDHRPVVADLALRP